MKKVILPLIILSIIISGCAYDNPLNRTVQIPENGSISAGVFESIRDNDDIGIFNGNSNDITYQWLFIGSLINTARDENLLVTFSNARTAEVRNQLDAQYVQEFSFGTGEPLGGTPTLSVYFPLPWNADFVEVYQFDTAANQANLIGTAALENSPNAIITFIPKEYRGLFHFVGRVSDGAGGNPQDSGESEDSGQPQHNPNQSDYVNPPNPTVSQDRFLTDPVPEGRPLPAEPGGLPIDTNRRLTATLSIRCDTILSNMDLFNPDKLPVLPSDGVIMNTRTVVFYEGESVFDILQREVRASRIHLEFAFTPIYNSVYVQGINNIYEFDAGALSGWMYRVNGWFPNYGASRYIVQQGDVIEWVYTVDLGRDVGGAYAVGE